MWCHKGHKYLMNISPTDACLPQPDCKTIKIWNLCEISRPLIRGNSVTKHPSSKKNKRMTAEWRCEKQNKTRILVELRAAASKRRLGRQHIEWNVQAGTGTVKSINTQKQPLCSAHTNQPLPHASRYKTTAAARHRTNAACVVSVENKSKVNGCSCSQDSTSSNSQVYSYKHKLLWTCLYFSSKGFSH